MGEEYKPKGKKKAVKLTSSTEASSINEKNTAKKFDSGSVNNLRKFSFTHFESF